LRVLIGYSCCPITREAFRSRGFDAWTCDLLPARDGSRFHLQGDVWAVANDDWCMGIFHPMCTFLTVSAAWAFKDPDFERYPGVGYHQRVKPGTLMGRARRRAREEAILNFRRLLNLPYPKAIENPAPSFISAAIRSPDQTIQPFQFGDDASKRTGLWLDRLPKLRPTGFASGRTVGATGTNLFGDGTMRWANQTDAGQNALSPSADRWLDRSATFPGIANAMGQQWCSYMEGRPA